eukprot:1160842-Pelagomonas_calceolata.AAC.10
MTSWLANEGSMLMKCFFQLGRYSCHRREISCAATLFIDTVPARTAPRATQEAFKALTPNLSQHPSSHPPHLPMCSCPAPGSEPAGPSRPQAFPGPPRQPVRQSPQLTCLPSPAAPPLGHCCRWYESASSPQDHEQM